MSDFNRRPRRTRRAKENPKQPLVRRRIARPDEPPDGSSRHPDRGTEEELSVQRPIWRDPDSLDLHPIPEEAWEVFELDEDAEAEPEPGDFRAEPEDEPLE